MVNVVVGRRRLLLRGGDSRQGGGGTGDGGYFLPSHPQQTHQAPEGAGQSPATMKLGLRAADWGSVTRTKISPRVRRARCSPHAFSGVVRPEVQAGV